MHHPPSAAGHRAGPAPRRLERRHARDRPRDCRRRLPGLRFALPHLPRDGRRDPGDPRCPPRYRRHQLDREELQGSRHLGRQGLRQRRRGRARARGHARFAPPRSRAPLARAEPGRPALADRGLRHGRADHPHRRRPRGLDRLRGQPRRRRVRPDRLAVPRLAQEPPAERRARPRSGRTSTGTTAIGGAAAAARPARNRPRPIAAEGAFSAPETRVIRDFMASRRVGGRQQIKTGITFHTAGEQILWPYGYTKADIPSDMVADDHAALVALGRKMAATNGYTAMQSSSLYVTDGDEIDWAYGKEHIFMYTFELYPSHSQVSSTARFYPPRRADRPADRTEQGGHPDAHRSRRLPVQRERHGQGQLRAALRQLPDLRRLDHEPARDRHGEPPVRGSAAIRPPRPARRGPSRPARTPSSPAAWPARRPTRTTSTTARPRSARRPSRSRRRSARCPSATTSRTARTRRPTTTSGHTSRMRPASGRSCARKSAPRTPTFRPGGQRRSR